MKTNNELSWRTDEFNEAIDILISEKPFHLTITKALEEFGELNVKLLQLLNKPDSITKGDIEEEIADCEMHFVVLNRLFQVSNEIREEKINKFLNSKDFLLYKERYKNKWLTK